MGNAKWTQDRFRKRLRVEREQRGWKQIEMAEMLSNNGIPMHWTTIAKIEKGDRSVRIDEAAGIADLLGVSVDVMLGRAVPDDANSVANEVRLARHTALKVQLDVQTSQASLTGTALALRAAAGWQPEDDARALMEGCTQAANALAEADDALAAADRILGTALAEAGGLTQ